MPYINFKEQQKVQIWEGVSASLFHSAQLTFAHVLLDQGAVVGEHQHVHEQWTHIVEGQMLFNLDGDEKLLTRHGGLYSF